MRRFIIISFLFAYPLIICCEQTMELIHYAILPLYKSENVIVSFFSNNPSGEDSLIFVQIKPIENQVDLEKNKNIILSDFILKNHIEKYIGKDFRKFLYNEKVVLQLNKICNITEYSEFSSIGFSMIFDYVPVSTLYTTEDIILYNRELYIKK